MTAVPGSQPLYPATLEEFAALMDVSPRTVRRYQRASVQLPDGRYVYGWPPGTAPARLTEHRLRDQLAAQLHGITEAVLPYGRADVLTRNAVFEVEPRRSWRNGIRQALAYSAQTGLPPAIALFGAIHHDELLKLYLKLRDQRLHANAGPIALWWWTGGTWIHISARSRCRNMPAP